MTAFPASKSFNALDESSYSLFPVENIKKNLVKEFATPLFSTSLMQTSECMKVFVRLRPSVDGQNHSQNYMEISEEGHVLTVNAPKESCKYRNSIRGIGEAIHKYAFTKVFSPDIEQKDFFDATALKVVEDFIGGQDALIFTYGVTSSGKTYTMQGIPGKEGIIPRAVDVIFNSLKKHLIESSNNLIQISEEEKLKLEQEKKHILNLAHEIELPQELSSKGPLGESSMEACETDQAGSSSSSITESLRRRSSFMDFVGNIADQSIVDISTQETTRIILFVSFIEIYNEQIYDLLKPVGKGKKRPSLKMAEDKSRPFVKDLKEIQVTSREEVFKLLEIGKNNLHVADTKLNHNSSRSHCIFTMKMVSLGESLTKPQVCQLSFCDLAGSERSGKTNSVGDRLVEARKINASLMTLGKCVETTRYNQQHKTGNQRVVPFRESRITRLFQNILQGNGRACMIVNISQNPILFDETIHGLNFSAIASQVKVNEKPPVGSRHRSSMRFAVKGRSSGSLGFNTSDQSKRFTIGWEPDQTPIKEMEENVQEEDSQEEEEDSQDEEEEESCDEEYWEDREKELLEEIENLKKKLSESEERVDDRQRSIEELNKHFKEYMDEMRESWEERLQKMEDFGETKYMNTVTQANRNIRLLQDEKKDLEARYKELDEECDELVEKLNVLEEKYDEDITLHEKISKLEKQLEEACQGAENESSGENTKAQDDDEKQKEIESLIEMNNIGKGIIQEQIGQIEVLEQEKRDLEVRLKTEVEKLKSQLEGAIDQSESHKKELEDQSESYKKELEDQSESHKKELEDQSELHKKEVEDQSESHKKEVEEEKERTLKAEMKLKEELATEFAEGRRSAPEKLISLLEEGTSDIKAHYEGMVEQRERFLRIKEKLDSIDENLPVALENALEELYSLFDDAMFLLEEADDDLDMVTRNSYELKQEWECHISNTPTKGKSSETDQSKLLAEVGNENDKLRNKVAEFRGQCGKLRSEGIQTTSRLQLKIDQLVKEKQELKLSTEKSINEWDQELSSRGKQLKQLQKRYDKAFLQMEAQQRSQDGDEKAMLELKEMKELELQTVRDQSESYKKELEDAKDREESYKKELEDAKDRLESYKKELEDAKDRSESYKKELEDAKDRSESYKKELEDAKDRSESYKKELEDAKDQSESYKKELEDAKDRLESYKKELEDAKDRSESYKKELEDAKDRSESYKKELEDAKDRAESYKKELEDAKDRLESYKKELEDAKDRSESYKKELEDAKDRSESYKKELEDAKDRSESYKKELEDAKCSLKIQTELKQQSDDLLTEAKSSKDQLSMLYDAVSDEVSEIGKQCEKLRSELIETTSLLTTRIDEVIKEKEEMKLATEKLMDAKDLEMSSRAKEWKELQERYTKALEDIENQQLSQNNLNNDHEKIMLELQDVKRRNEEMLIIKDEIDVMSEREVKMKLQADGTHEELVELKKKNEELQSTLEEAVSCSEMKIVEEQKLHKKLDDLQKEKNQMMKVHKKEIGKLERELRTINDEGERLRSELQMANKIEKELMAEVEKLQEKVNKLEGDASSIKRLSDHQPIQVQQLEKDVHFLSLERDDLIANISKMKEELGDLKKENASLKKANHETSMSVGEASELEKMKSLLKDKEEEMEKQQQELSRYRLEEGQLEKARAAMTEMDNLQENQQEIISQHESDKQRHQVVVDQLQSELTNLKSAQKDTAQKLEKTQATLKKFREARDKLSSSLERQINTERTCNAELKKKLEDQIECNVKLMSEKSKLVAELQVKTHNSPMRKSLSETSLPQLLNRKLQVASQMSPSLEVSSPLESVLMCNQSTSTSPSVEVEKLSSAPENIPKDSLDPSDACTAGRGRSRSKDTLSRPVKKTLSRKKRQATPIPQTQSSVDDCDPSPPKTRRVLRQRKTATVQVESSADNAESSDHDNTLTNEGLDKSTSSRITDHERDFPKSEMEIDVTPQVKKTRTRKRTNKQECDENDSENLPSSSVAKSRPRRRGRIDDVTSADETVLKSRSNNITDIIKNSPVGQALKKFEAAISPARQPTISGPTSLTQNDPQRQSTRRLRKLHAEDISLPLQTTPDENAGVIGAIGRGVGLPPHAQSPEPMMKRRLRRRK